MKKRYISRQDKIWVYKFYNACCKCRINGTIVRMKFTEAMTELLDNNNKIGIEVTDNKELNKIISELKYSKE